MRKSYRTRHRLTIENYLKGHRERDFSASELHQGLQEEGWDIGIATVYRQIANLVEEGFLHVLQSQGDEERFHYLGDPKECAEHYHLKCRCCGKLLHLHCVEVDQLSSHMNAHHGFSIDWNDSLLYGKCKECKTKESK